MDELPLPPISRRFATMKSTLGFAAIVFTAFLLCRAAQAQVECGVRYDSRDSPLVMTEDVRCRAKSHQQALTLEGPLRLEMRGQKLACPGPGGDGIRAIGRGVEVVGPGRISGCGDAVTLSGRGSHSVQHTKIKRAENAVISFSPSNTIQSNRIRNIANNGVWLLSDARSSTISDNKIKQVSGGGVVVASGSRDFSFSTEISGNKIVDPAETGIEGAPGTRIEHNSITRPGQDGIAIRARVAGMLGTNAQIIDNEIRRAGAHGIHLHEDTLQNTVQNNRIENSRENGIHVVLQSHENWISGNDVEGSSEYDMVDENPACGDNAWSENTFDTKTPGRSCIR